MASTCSGSNTCHDRELRPDTDAGHHQRVVGRCLPAHNRDSPDEAAKAIAERLLHGDEVRNIDSHKVFGSKLDEQQQFAMFITTVILEEIDRRWKRPLKTAHKEELRGIIQSAVYSSLHAYASYDRLASSREFVDAIRVLMPRYFMPARLIGDLVSDH